MDQEEYLLYWRYRITGMIVYFLDENGKVIPNDGENDFGMIIQYPDLFYDRDRSKVAHLFGAHPFQCTSIYRGIDQPHKRCKVSNEFQFAKYIFSPSPNGTFTFTLKDKKNSLDLAKVHRFKIIFSGSQVQFTKNARERKEKLKFDYKRYKFGF